MNEYIITLLAISALVAIASYISYGESQDRTLKCALAIILLYVIASPTVTLVRGFLDSDFYKNSFDSPEISFSDTDFATDAERAFCEGVGRFVAREFNFSEDEVSVAVFGFDAKAMKAQKIKIILRGSAVLGDNRMISQRISAEGLGECEVELDIS